MDIEIDDEVIYTPNLETLDIDWKRTCDWGVVTGIFEDNYRVRFRLVLRHYLILKDSISLAPYSKKRIQYNFKKSLTLIKNAVEAREARRVMLWKTNMSIRLPGPAHLIQGFLNDFKRSKYILNQ